MGQNVKKRVSYRVDMSMFKPQRRVDEWSFSAACGVMWACVWRQIISTSMRSWFAMASHEPNAYTVLSLAAICIDTQNVDFRCSWKL